MTLGGRLRRASPCTRPGWPGARRSTEPSRIERVSPGWVTAVTLANLGLFMAYFGPLGVLLPNQVQAIAGVHRIIGFSWISGLGAVVAIVANPLAGALSDRTPSPGSAAVGRGRSAARSPPRPRCAW